MMDVEKQIDDVIDFVEDLIRESIDAYSVQSGIAVRAPMREKLRTLLSSAQSGEPAAQQAVQAVQAAVPVVRGEVLVTVSGFTGSGKSAIAGEIEIMCRALGLQVEWPDGVTEKNMTHADWTTALELYNPRVRIIERNVPRNTASGADQ